MSNIEHSSGKTKFSTASCGDYNFEDYFLLEKVVRLKMVSKIDSKLKNESQNNCAGLQNTVKLDDEAFAW